jgi:hypothetical protein
LGRRRKQNENKNKPKTSQFILPKLRKQSDWPDLSCSLIPEDTVLSCTRSASERGESFQRLFLAPTDSSVVGMVTRSSLSSKCRDSDRKCRWGPSGSCASSLLLEQIKGVFTFHLQLCGSACLPQRLAAHQT